jgi:CRISPR type IV-associated protein Csf3
MIQQKIKAYIPPKWSFEPFKLRFHLDSPVMLSYPFLFFDGLIAHIHAQVVLDDIFGLLPRNPINFIDGLPLPIKKLEWNNDYIYCASTSHFLYHDAISTTNIRKKFDDNNAIEHLDMSIHKNTKIDTQRGTTKNYDMRMIINYSPYVDFWVNGDIDAIMELCKFATGLGKKRNVGYGKVRKVELLPCVEDQSVFYKGLYNRPVPIELAKGLSLPEYQKIVNIAYKPPYWDKANVKPCYVPEG